MTRIFVSFSRTQFKFLNIIYAHNKVSHKVTNIRIQKEIKHTIKDKKKKQFHYCAVWSTGNDFSLFNLLIFYDNFIAQVLADIRK